MARKWASGISGSVNSSNMDEMLIEVFGCVSLDTTVTRFDSRRDKAWNQADFAAYDRMAEALIEIYSSVVPEGERRLRAG